MEKIQQLDLMDKILRELDDLKNSQTSVLKKLAQIEADNINLGVAILDDKLPDIHTEVDSSIEIMGTLVEEFQQHRDNFYTSNNLAAMQDPTA